jgi:hypothetical protein
MEEKERNEVHARCLKIIDAAVRFRKAKLATGKCSEMMLSNGKSRRAAAVMGRYMKAEEALMAACDLESALTPLEKMASNSPKAKKRR